MSAPNMTYRYIGVVVESDAFLEDLHHRFPDITLHSTRRIANGELLVHLSCSERDTMETAVRYLFSDEGMPDPALDITEEPYGIR